MCNRQACAESVLTLTANTRNQKHRNLRINISHNFALAVRQTDGELGWGGTDKHAEGGRGDGGRER